MDESAFFGCFRLVGTALVFMMVAWQGGTSA